LADSVALLAAADRRHVIRHMAVRLSSKLTAQCNTFDHFTFLLQQRVHVLHSVQSAMMRAWPRCNPNLLQLYLQERLGANGVDTGVGGDSNATSTGADVGGSDIRVKEALAKLATLTTLDNFSLASRKDGSGPGTKSGGGSSRGLASLPHSAQLGIRLFFSLLECISEPDSDPQVPFLPPSPPFPPFLMPPSCLF
jgi:hypothetical protein